MKSVRHWLLVDWLSAGDDGIRGEVPGSVALVEVRWTQRERAAIAVIAEKKDRRKKELVCVHCSMTPKDAHEHHRYSARFAQAMRGTCPYQREE